MANAARLARCPFKACPVRYRTGSDRLCAEHDDRNAVRLAAESLGIDLAIDRAPGDKSGDGDGAQSAGDDR
jgi:hypothetical protein